MKMSAFSIDNIAKSIADQLLCTVGLQKAKKIAGQVKRNLLAEDRRRKELESCNSK